MQLEVGTVDVSVLLGSFLNCHLATPDEASQPPVVETTEPGTTKDEDVQCPETNPAAPMEYTGNN